MQEYNPQNALAEFPEAAWEKSEFSGGEGGGGCVDVNMAVEGKIGLRDSKQPSVGAFVFNPQEWDAFVKGVKAGQFDLPA